jgi:hypothetical protein
VITGLALGAGVGGEAWAVKGFDMMMTVNAPPIRMSLVILVGCGFDLSFMFFCLFV